MSVRTTWAVAAAVSMIAPACRDRGTDDLVLSARERRDVLRRAQVWQPPPVPVERADLGHNAAGRFAGGGEVTCRFVVDSSAGLTPKFRCIDGEGRRIKVKYGRRNLEPAAELIGTRLLRALGFGADPVHAARRVVCRGCPFYPYPRLPWLDALRADPRRTVVFENVTIEEPFEGREVRSPERDGWGFDELDLIDPSAGGAPRAHVDALRLLAVFLANWDIKPPNQRLVCLPGTEPSAVATCAHPLAMMHDLGAVLGPKRLDVDAWAKVRVWRDRASCRVDMQELPWNGVTFVPVQIGEEGRLMLAGLLGRLSREQLHGLFTAAAAVAHGAIPDEGVDRWVRTFENRRALISDGPPCPDGPLDASRPAGDAGS